MIFNMIFLHNYHFYIDTPFCQRIAVSSYVVSQMAKGCICRYPLTFCNRTLAKGCICRYTIRDPCRYFGKRLYLQIHHTGSMPLLWQKTVSADTPYGIHAVTLAKGCICRYAIRNPCRYFGKRLYLQIRHTGSMPLLWQKDVSAETPYGIHGIMPLLWQ